MLKLCFAVVVNGLVTLELFHNFNRLSVQMTVCASNYMKAKILNNCVMYRENLKVYIH